MLKSNNDLLKSHKGPLPNDKDCSNPKCKARMNYKTIGKLTKHRGKLIYQSRCVWPCLALANLIDSYKVFYS